MCPLRIILVFLSAALAGLFVLKKLKSPPGVIEDDPSVSPPSDHSSHSNRSSSSKVWAAMATGFWTCLDMASGRYLWRNLVPSSSKRSAS